MKAELPSSRYGDERMPGQQVVNGLSCCNDRPGSVPREFHHADLPLAQYRRLVEEAKQLLSAIEAEFVVDEEEFDAATNEELKKWLKRVLLKEVKDIPPEVAEALVDSYEEDVSPDRRKVV